MQKRKAERKRQDMSSLLFGPLHDAHNQLWNALLPLSPFRALVPEDIQSAESALTIWENASDSITILAYDSPNNRPNTNLLLVEAMLRFCDYAAGILDITGTDQTDTLRQRFVRLKHHIENALLSEARSSERLERAERSDAQCDLDLVRDWAVEIREELLKPGQRTEHWSYLHLPWIMENLTTWEKIEFSILSESGITLVMRDIIHAPTIPIISFMQPLRNWATSLLHRWQSRPEAVALSSADKTRLGLDTELPSDTLQPSMTVYPTAPILYRIGEVATDLRALTDAVADHTPAGKPRIFQALDKIAAWKADTEPLSAQGIYNVLGGLQTTPGLRHPDAEVGDRIYAVMAEFFKPMANLQRRVTSFSYSYLDGPTFPLTFRDMNSLPDAFSPSGSMFGIPDDRVWNDVVVETNATTPINLLFSEFMVTANIRHRHPLVPLQDFSFTSTPEPFYSYTGKTVEEVKVLQDRIWFKGSGNFSQGQVKDLPITEDHVVYHSRTFFNVTTVPEVNHKLPHERTLPQSCVAPGHWIRPTPPPGGDAVWRCLPSLAFVGNGHDLYPGVTTPPAIASHIYVPRSFEPLGLYQNAAYRQAVTKECTPMKLEPPLTVAQARALLGRAIQYEVAVVPIPTPPEGVRPKKKRREEPPPIYWGVVWGVDDSEPAGLKLKIFTGGQYQEASATLTVGEPCAIPIGRIDTKLPFTPKWVGALALVDEAAEAEITEEPAIEPAAPKIEGEDRLTSILKLGAQAPRFEVGIGGDCVILVGEIALHGVTPDSNSIFTSIEQIENCKPGIWQGGRDANEEFLIWVCWVSEGSIDLAQPVENFIIENVEDVDIETLTWTEVSNVPVDGGTMTILARGVTSPDAMLALNGEEDDEEDGLVKFMALSGAEDDYFNIPGGVSSYTGGDGGFSVYVSSDSEGKVIGVKVGY
ncbi:hypothetical protein R3P38DRAFT_2969438 [Favolaschia claudopus]|uniref:Uncharacterized protein n=1 Tax=Favolaschia claudopus TaxID=2862362 RepID=A0AAW0B3N7_9AGAR